MRSTCRDILEPTSVISDKLSFWGVMLSPHLLIVVALSVLAVMPALASASVWEACAVIVTLGSALILQVVPNRSLSREQRDRWSAGLWGAVVPILPLLGDGGIVAVSIGMVLLLGVQRLHLRRFVWILPLLCLLCGNLITEVMRQAPEYFRAASINDFARARTMIEWFLHTHAYSWRCFSHVITFGLVVALFESLPVVFEGVRRGLGIGVVIAAVVTIAQHFDIAAVVLPNQTAFWTSINRLSGTFSDPNALGIFLAIAPFLIFEGIQPRAASRCFLFVLSALILSAGLLSGSRSFVLALVLGLLAGVWLLSRRLLIVSVAIGAICIAVLSVLDLYTPWVEGVISSDFMPEGARRVLMSCSLVRASQSFFSRGVFFTLGWHLFEYFPLFGVGSDQFRYYVPALVDRLGLNIGGWTDNSNNFYLGLLTELGLLGVLVFIVTICGRCLVKRPNTFCIVGLFVLFCILFTGPHLDFPEVLFLVAGLIAAATRSRDVGLVRLSSLAAVSMGIGILGPLAREQGGYLWESHRPHFEQWLSPAAEIAVACSCKGFAELVLESSYVPTTSPLTVSVEASSGEVQEVSFKRPEAKKLIFRCADQPLQSLDHYPGKMRFSVLTTPGWSPVRAWPEVTTDRRILGIKVRNRRWEDLLAPERCVRSPNLLEDE